MTWPVSDAAMWRALQPGQQLIDGELHEIVVVDCGNLVLPSGRLAAVDPFVTLARHNPYYLVPAGAYPARVTIDETLEREMYVSLIFAPTAEVDRRLLIPYQPNGERCAEPEADQFYGIAVDAGTVAFVDDEAIQRYVPQERLWYEELFENDSPDCWFKLMDNPEHIRAGLANIPLPGATDGANIIIAHSGWGDGFYPVVGSYDMHGNLVAVHIDLLIHYDD